MVIVVVIIAVISRVTDIVQGNFLMLLLGSAKFFCKGQLKYCRPRGLCCNNSRLPLRHKYIKTVVGSKRNECLSSSRTLLIKMMRGWNQLYSFLAPVLYYDSKTWGLGLLPGTQRRKLSLRRIKQLAHDPRVSEVAAEGFHVGFPELCRLSCLGEPVCSQRSLLIPLSYVVDGSSVTS